jgi:hypothetical protein
VTAKDVAEFLQIDVRTLYNYANYTIDQLPTVAKDKFVDFFSKYDEFDAELDLRDVFDILENIENISLKLIRKDFLILSYQRKKERILQRAGTTVASKSETSIIEELLKELGINITDYNLTKGYLYSLFEVVFSNIKGENDYQLIDYISKYKKKM